MRGSLLTKRQMEILRYRKRGMTQQQIADICHTSKANICSIERNAMRKIQYAQNALKVLRILDARKICTLEEGSDLFDSVPLILAEAEKAGIPLPDDPMMIINRIRLENPDRIHGRYVKKEILVYLQSNGDLDFR